VAYEAAIDPYGNAHAIHVANADGTNVRRVAGGGATVAASPASPAWSPDGRLIAYGVNRAIYVVRPDGTGRRRLIRGASQPWASALWASDGARLAYLCGRARPSRTFALCVVGTTGRGRRVIARDVLGAAWSRRGLRLAYARRDGIFVVNADGRVRKRLARKEAGVSIRSLAWSADNRRLVLTQGRDHNDLEIYSAESDGTHVKALTNNAVNELQPSWAPDGRQLAFVRMRGSLGDIWLMDASGRRQRLVVQDGFSPSWTPDASRIVFTRWIRGSTGPYSTYSVSVSGADERLLVSDGAFSAPSPDGAKLAFLRSSPSPFPFPEPGQLFTAAADGTGATL
jgi:Tol biopolymer transport system component